MQTIIINEIFEILSKNNPAPTTELEYKDEFTLIIAIILSAQATDVSVNIATRKLFETYDTPSKIIMLGEEKLKEYIRNIGLYNTKSRNIIKLCNILIDEYQGKVPNDFEVLIALPGVGRKTANVFLNCMFQQPVIGVDTHVFRVATRLGLTESKSFPQVEKDLLTIVPAKWLPSAHNWLVLHGRYICKARKPKCEECKIRNFCQYYTNYKSYGLS